MKVKKSVFFIDFEKCSKKSSPFSKILNIHFVFVWFFCIFSFSAWSGYLGGDPVLPQEEPHPNLFFKSEQIPQLQEKINHQATAALYQTLKSRADTGVGLVNQGVDLTQRHILPYGRDCALVYQITGDNSYGQAAKAILLAYSKEKINELLAGSDLLISEHLALYCVIWDWLAESDLLDASEKQLIMDNIGKEAVFLHNTYFTPSPEFYRNNHESKAYAAAGIAALTNPSYPYDETFQNITAEYVIGKYNRIQIFCQGNTQCSSTAYSNLINQALDAFTKKDYKTSNEYLNQALDLINYPLPETLSGILLDSLFFLDRYLAWQISPNGAYFESINYLHFTFQELYPFGMAYLNRCGVDIFSEENPNLRDVFSWLVQIRMPSGYLPTFGDDWYQKISLIPPLSSLYNYPEGAELLWDFNHGLPPGTPKNDIIQAYSFITYPLSLVPKSPEDTGIYFFQSEGQAIFRTGWGENEVYFALMGQPRVSGHGHEDQTSFQLFSYGAWQAIDCGYGPQTKIGKPHDEDPSFWRAAEQHNILKIDNYGPSDDIVSNQTYFDPFTLSYPCHTPFLSFVDTVGKYSQVPDAQLKRTIMYIPESSDNQMLPYFVLIDDVLASQPHLYQWILHGLGDLEEVSESSLVYTNVAGDKFICLLVAAPSFSEIQQETGYHSFAWGQEDSHKYIRINKSSQNAQYLVVLYPYEDHLTPPEIFNVGTSKVTAAKIELAHTIDVALVNHYKEYVNIDGIQTDADIAFRRALDFGMPGDPDLKFMMIKNGKYFTYNQHPYLSGPTQLNFACLEWDDVNEEVFGIINSPSNSELTLFLPPDQATYVIALKSGENNIAVPYSSFEYQKKEIISYTK